MTVMTMMIMIIKMHPTLSSHRKKEIWWEIFGYSLMQLLDSWQLNYMNIDAFSTNRMKNLSWAPMQAFK